MGRVSKLCEPVGVIFSMCIVQKCLCLSVYLYIYIYIYVYMYICVCVCVCKKFQTWEFQPLNLGGTKSPRTEVLGSGLCVLSVGNDRSALETWAEVLAGNLS